MSAGSDTRFAASEDAYHEAASKELGLDDFGDPSYREALGRLLRSFDEDAHLSDLGRAIVRQELIKILKSRLLCEARLKQHAGECEQEIRRPIIILGLVRTGSTALHYLMGQDPGIQKLEYWMSANPQPRPPREEWDEHADFRASQAEIDFLYKVTPSLMAVHEMRAEWPEECRHILAQSFTDDRFETSATLPGYNQWYWSTPHPETYRRHRRLVQLIGMHEPDRRWLLKYPVHLRQLQALFDVYPDACIVQTHRDPRTVMASYTSFVAKVREMHEDRVDMEYIAREQLESWSTAADAGVAYRREHGSERFFDLHFTDFMADPVGSVKRIYQHFDQVLSPEGEKCLEQWQGEHPQGKHGQHSYKKDDFGLSESEILDRFADYMEFHGMQA
ncbi:MAG: sulfotransferase [Deltaproteobacteria bacterium]|nr:sulfotransferase [Deltaproteobacteria bacterium]